MAKQKLTISGGILREIDETIVAGRKIEPFYYDDELFGEWRHHSNGWAPPEGYSSQLSYGKHNSTDRNQFHLRVKKDDISVNVTVGPKRQDISVSRRKSPMEAVSETRFAVPYAPYLVFMAVLRDPERFLESQKT